MNNYSWLQQKLHQVVLSSNFIQEVAFNVESWAMPKKKHSKNNVFIAGLARSGTTSLLNALYKSNDFAITTSCPPRPTRRFTTTGNP